MSDSAAAAVRVPFVDLRAQYQSLKPELLAQVAQALETMHLFLGPNVQAFEEEFAAYCGTRHAIAVDSGTSALFLALRALDVGPGDEVITVSNTFIATVGAVIQAGATPVFVDVVPNSLLMDLEQLEQAITPRTKAIIPVHLYGQMVDMPRLRAIASKHAVAVVEDACQAHGAAIDGARAGSWGHLGCFSFYFTKNLGAYGEMGMITTNDSGLCNHVRALRDHGSLSKYQHVMFGGNFRPDEIQASMLRVKLAHLEGWNERRRQLARTYMSGLEGLKTVTCLATQEPQRHVHHLFVVRARGRDRLAASLRERGIETGIHYPVPIHQQEAWASRGLPSYRLPKTEAAATEILSLPMYPELTPQQQRLVIESVAEFDRAAER